MSYLNNEYKAQINVIYNIAVPNTLEKFVVVSFCDIRLFMFLVNFSISNLQAIKGCSRASIFYTGTFKIFSNKT